jgi:hypothetical protein
LNPFKDQTLIDPPVTLEPAPKASVVPKLDIPKTPEEQPSISIVDGPLPKEEPLITEENKMFEESGNFSAI